MTNTYSSTIVFGTGPLGCAVAEELLAKGKSVKMVNKSGKGKIPEGALLVKADVTDPELTREVCRGAKTIFHCAMPPYTLWAEMFPSITYGIMEGASYAGAELIYGDNLYMYSSGNEKLTENLPYRAKGPKGKVRAEMADRLMSAHKEGKVKVTIGRASDFYGPRVINSIIGEKVIKPAIEGKSINMLWKIDQPHTYTFIRDFAKGLVILSEHETTFGEIWHIPSAETISTKKFLHLLFNITETFPSVKTAPKIVVNLLALFNPIIKELKEVLPTYEKPYIVDHTKFEQAFGNHSTPHEKALKETVDWYRQTFNL